MKQNPINTSRIIRIVALGDSITYGWVNGFAIDGCYVNLVERKLVEDGFNLQMINKGIPGDTSRGGLDRLERDVTDLKPDMATVMFGTNDALMDEWMSFPNVALEDYRDNMKMIVRRLIDKQITPVLMTTPPLGRMLNFEEEYVNTDRLNRHIDKYMDVIRSIAGNEKITLVDHFTYWMEQSQQGVNLDLWLYDGVHPNANGHEVLADKLFDVLLPLLKQRYAFG